MHPESHSGTLTPEHARDLVDSAPSAGQHSVFLPNDRTKTPGKLTISVVIPAFNEEVNIRDCIASCVWSVDIHILDSGSKDLTCGIARAMGATVHTNKFESFGDQRHWVIDHIPCKHARHFHLDADERFTPDLLAEVFDRLGPDRIKSDCSAYQCPSKMILINRWLKWSGGYPSYQVRLFRFGQCRFMAFGHGQREVFASTMPGATVELSVPAEIEQLRRELAGARASGDLGGYSDEELLAERMLIVWRKPG